MATNTLPAAGANKSQQSKSTGSSGQTRVPPKRPWRDYRDLVSLVSILGQCGGQVGYTVYEIVGRLNMKKNTSHLEVLGADRSRADLSGVVETGLMYLVQEGVVDKSDTDHYLLFPDHK